VDYRPAERIHAQGDPAESIFVPAVARRSRGSRRHLGRRGLFGEGSMAGQRVRLGTLAALIATRIRIVPTQQMIRLLHDEHALSDRFSAHILFAEQRSLVGDLLSFVLRAPRP
jgi:hypothetical protein